MDGGSRAAARRSPGTERRSLTQCRRVSSSLHEGESAVEARAVRREVRPAARTGGMRERDDRDAVELVPLADALGQRRQAEERPEREAAGGHDQPRPEKLELPAVPERAQVALARRRGPVAAARRRAARDSSASPTRSRTSRRTRPRRARASGGASVRRGRATAAAPRLRRCRAPVRTGTHAGPRPARGRAATRAGSRPRRRRGSGRGRAGATRAIDTRICGGHMVCLLKLMRDLFSFPNPVNETSARLVAGAVAVLAVVAIAFQQGWILPMLAYGFVARALTGPKLSPLALVATRVVTPRLHGRTAIRPARRSASRRRSAPCSRVTATLLWYAAGQHTAALRSRRRDRGVRVARVRLRAVRRLQGVLPRDAARARPAAASARTARRRRAPVVSGRCCRSRASRTSRRAATAATIDAIGDGARRARARCSTSTRTPTTTARSSRSSATRRSSSTRCSPASRARASASTCARTKARIRASAPPTSSRSSPIRPEDMRARARGGALELARRIGEELGLPVFLYGELGAGRGPAFFRRGGPEELQRRIDDGELAPDFGPAQLHPSAGGVIVGARRPLIAFNVNLADADVDAARAIARVVRERDGGFPGVRALGLDLPQAGHAQVSMNVEDWEAAALHEIVAAIEREAAARGVEVAGAELVGLDACRSGGRGGGRDAADRRLRRLARSRAAAARVRPARRQRPRSGPRRARRGRRDRERLPRQALGPRSGGRRAPSTRGSGRLIVPSRSTAVQRRRATPAARQRSTASSTERPLPCSHPRMRTSPSRTSTATTSRSPSASTYASGPCSKAAVPTMTRAAPAPTSAKASVGRAHAAAELERDRGDRGREPAGELDRGAAVAGGVEHDHVEQGRAGRGKRRASSIGSPASRVTASKSPRSRRTARPSSTSTAGMT